MAILGVPRKLTRAATIVGTVAANIEEVPRQRAFTTLPAQNAQLEMVLQTRGPERIEQVIKALRMLGCRRSWIRIEATGQ